MKATFTLFWGGMGLRDNGILKFQAVKVPYML